YTGMCTALWVPLQPIVEMSSPRVSFCGVLPCSLLLFFFFLVTATPESYTLSLHDALPICARSPCAAGRGSRSGSRSRAPATSREDRKSTRLNSSHRTISYAVFCLKKKNDHDQLCNVRLPSRSRNSVQQQIGAHGTTDDADR